VAREHRGPVYGLTGGVDPIVPWPWVWRWLRRYSPGFREGEVIWGAGHNVLLDAPERSVAQVMKWVA
jgi:pimeloyl-ACP methyl ester carboxylesterase